MKHLYAPWRTDYLMGDKKEECVFCSIKEHLDEEKQSVIFYDEYLYVVMNKYPYAAGHIMVIPYTHTDNIESLKEEEWQAISKRVRQGVILLKKVLNAQGVNIGMNLGAIAGAGIAQHVHYHLVPRWFGDTNFVTSISNLRVYPTDFNEICKKLRNKSKEYFI